MTRGSGASPLLKFPAAAFPMLTFRCATPDDLPRLSVLAERIWRASYRDLLQPAQIDYMLAWMYSAEAIAEELSRGVWWEVIGLDGESIGYSAAEHFPGEATVKLHKLYLLPEQQGRGFAQAALQRISARARAAGAERLLLNVNKGNTRAQQAYLRAGFRIVASVVNEIGGGFVMDDFLMERALG